MSALPITSNQVILNYCQDGSIARCVSGPVQMLNNYKWNYICELIRRPTVLLEDKEKSTKRQTTYTTLHPEKSNNVIFIIN